MAERVSFDRIADVYDETRGLPPRVLAKTIGVLAEALEGKWVLEVGVGTGRYAVPLQKSGIEVVGVDISPRMVARGLAKGLRDVVFAEGARLPFRDGSFDAATTNHVLHLVADWPTVLQEIARVLRPDGSYFTVIEQYRGTSLTDRYREIARSLGYVHLDPGLHEREFPRLVVPARVVRAAHHEQSGPADELLDTVFANRQYAFLWKVPDDVHENTMEALRREFGGQTRDRSFVLEIAWWTRPQVEMLAKASH